MIYGFDTDDKNAATGALLVYAIYRSRDKSRFKVTPALWGQIERFVKSSAKRATTLPAFMESLKPRLSCGTVSPKWMEAGVKNDISLLAIPKAGGTEFIQYQADDQREFLTGVLAEVEHRHVLDQLYRETGWIVLLVRDRLEREKPIEQNTDIQEEEIN